MLRPDSSKSFCPHVQRTAHTSEAPKVKERLRSPSSLRATVRRKTCNSANSSPVHPRGPKRARRPLMAPEIVESFSGIPRTRTVSDLPSSSLRRFFCLGNRTAGLSCCGYEWSRRQGRSTNGGRENDASSATFEGGRGGEGAFCKWAPSPRSFFFPGVRTCVSRPQMYEEGPAHFSLFPNSYT